MLGDAFVPSAESCLIYQCGGDPQNMANIIACSSNGFYGVRSCLDPACAPFSNCPKTPTIQTPAGPVPLTPQSLVKALPDITAVLTPIRVPDCSCWQKLNSWIGDNPLIAVAALGGAFFFMRGAMKRG